MQQVLKNVRHSPYFGRFIIARRRALSSVRSATEGGSPSRPVRGSGSNRRPEYRGERQNVGRQRGLRGTLQGAVHPAETGPFHRANFGGHDEDGEKPSPRRRGGSGRGCGGAGSRSSRQGPTGRIREDLPSVRRR